LRNNNFTKIRGIERLKKLQSIYFGFNKISEDKNIKKLKHLKIIDIKNTEPLINSESLIDR